MTEGAGFGKGNYQVTALKLSGGGSPAKAGALITLGNQLVYDDQKNNDEKQK